MAKTPATQAMIERALRAWQKCGLPVGSVSIGPDGTVTVSSQVAHARTMSEYEEDALVWDVATGLVDRKEADRLPEEKRHVALQTLANHEQNQKKIAELARKRRRKA